jgi:hypothetical protein
MGKERNKKRAGEKEKNRGKYRKREGERQREL